MSLVGGSSHNIKSTRVLQMLCHCTVYIFNIVANGRTMALLSSTVSFWKQAFEKSEDGLFNNFWIYISRSLFTISNLYVMLFEYPDSLYLLCISIILFSLFSAKTSMSLLSAILHVFG